MKGLLNEIGIERSSFYSNSTYTDGFSRMALGIMRADHEKRQELFEQFTDDEKRLLNEVISLNSKILLPQDYNGETWFGLASKASGYSRRSPQIEEAYKVLNRVAEEAEKLRSRKKSLFFIPKDFEDTTFEGYEIVTPEQQTAWTILTHYGAVPQRGLYLWGNYGSGKTHLICAFARGLLAELGGHHLSRLEALAQGVIDELSENFRELVELDKERTIRKENYDGEEDELKLELTERLKVLMQDRGGLTPDDYLQAWNDYKKSDEECIKVIHKIRELEKAYNDGRTKSEEEFGDKLKKLNKKFPKAIPTVVETVAQQYPFHPTDVAFATFECLFDQREDTEFIEDFLSRRIIIVDDLHPKGNEDRLTFIQRLIEYRYNEVRDGRIFITSNLPPDKLVTAKDYPKEVAERVSSRLQEMCFPIHFDTDDYRLRRSQKANEELLSLVERLQDSKE